jgi:hypothetical protein
MKLRIPSVFFPCAPRVTKHEPHALLCWKRCVDDDDDDDDRAPWITLPHCKHTRARFVPPNDGHHIGHHIPRVENDAVCCAAHSTLPLPRRNIFPQRWRAHPQSPTRTRPRVCVRANPQIHKSLFETHIFTQSNARYNIGWTSPRFIWYPVGWGLPCYWRSFFYAFTSSKGTLSWRTDWAFSC